MMIFPEFLQDNEVVGVTACSCGVLRKIDKYLKTVERFKENNLRVIETSNVRTNGVVSSDSKVRAKELKELYLNPDVKMINVAAGGDFLLSMLPYVDYDVIRNNVKWIGGSSDPTSLIYTITTKYDIATIYTPCNMSGMKDERLLENYQNYFSIIKGNLVTQTRSDFYLDNNDEKVHNEWLNINGDVDETGILIGGCLDSLKDIIGTSFDGTSLFLDKYKNEGIIWYFDVFALGSEVLYNTLLQFKFAGYFEGVKAILIGKVKYPSSFNDLSYEELIRDSLPDVKVIFNFDIGHVKPSMVMINGAKVRVVSNKCEGSLKYL